MTAHILLVEDDAFIAALFERVLVRLGHYTVTMTEDADRVLDLVQAGQVHLVIMDVALRRTFYRAEAIDGITLTRLVKAGGAAAPPVLLVTAHAMPGDAERLLAASGADGYLSKPLPHPRLLIERVQRLLERSET